MSVVGGVRKAVGGFLRYVQYRDQQLEPGSGQAIDAYLRYMSHRDRTSAAGRIFGKDGPCSSVERRQFVDYVARSTRGLEPKWVERPGGTREDRHRAVYSFILSPEDWRDLDLRQLTSVAMKQLEADAGPAGIGPWFAAEHRNTAHHHVHIVLAARREIAPRRFSTLVITRARLQRMKDAIALEIERQRSRDIAEGRADIRTPAGRVAKGQALRPVCPSRATAHARWMTARTARKAERRPGVRPRRGTTPGRSALVGLTVVARRYSERMGWELEREAARAEHEGWVR